MAAAERWYFSEEQIKNSPSFKFGYDIDKELSCRQQAANFIQDMGQKLQVTQLCINTAIVYMHRFYMFHSFTRFHRTSLASAALFLAAKVEEQPRKLEHIIRVANVCLHREPQPFDIKSEAYNEQAQDLIMNENILLQTLGFDVAIDHPHTHIVKCCQLVRASKDLAQTSYFMASYSLHLTTMCLQYKPTVVACFCIHLACKWSNWEIPDSSEGRPWFWYVDKSVTSELLEKLTNDFLSLFEKCPSRLKKKIASLSYQHMPQGPEPCRSSSGNSIPDMDKRREAARAAVESHVPQQALSTPSSGSNAPPASHPYFHPGHLIGEEKKPPRPVPDPYKKPHHQSSSHHTRSDANARAPVTPASSSGGTSAGNKLAVPPPTTPVTTATSGGIPGSGLPSTQTAKAPLPPPVRPSVPRVRNGDHHVPKKPEVEVKPWVVKREPWPVRPVALLQPRPRTPPQPAKPERSIFSPEEKASPPPAAIVKAVSPPPPIATLPPTPAVPRASSPAVVPPVIPPSTNAPSSPPKPNGDLLLSDPTVALDKAHKKKKKKHKDHKDKHKDKHKHKHKLKDPEPIKITIPKEKISFAQPPDIKIKIAKEKITPTSAGLKIKISKDKLKDPKKRERSEERETNNQQSAKHHRPNGTTVQVGAEGTGHH